MSELIDQLLNLLGDLKGTLTHWLSIYGTQFYFILALIIFCETGLVVTPFLPGDSLLFTAGVLAGDPANNLNVWILIPLLFAAALLGDHTNYFFGRFLGQRVYERDYWFLKRKHIDKTHAFYEKYGGRTLVIARFVPIVRTFAPFVAGVGKMEYRTFLGYCLMGGGLWVTGITLLGYFFGGTEFVQNNFETVIFAIIGISVLPIVVEFARAKWGKKE